MQLPPDYTTESHDEADTGQQELYVALGGAGAVVIGDERLPLDPEHLVRVDAGTGRVLTSGPDGLRVLCIGAVPGRPYEPPAWTTGAAGGRLTVAPPSSRCCEPADRATLRGLARDRPGGRQLPRQRPDTPPTKTRLRSRSGEYGAVQLELAQVREGVLSLPMLSGDIRCISRPGRRRVAPQVPT